MCQKNSKSHIDFQKYNIETNTDCEFRGEKIAVLYEQNIGIYPYIEIDSNKKNILHNGGLPQNVDINEHLKKLEENINKLIPDKNFSGIGVIDIEEWRPLFFANWDSKSVYKEESIKIVKEKMKNKRKIEIEIKARKEFDKAALIYFKETILKCKNLRPQAQWGFYGFPTCNQNSAQKNGEACFSTLSDEYLKFLQYADVILPAPYIVHGQNYTTKDDYVEGVILETLRIVKRLKNKGHVGKKIFLYNKIEVDPLSQNPDDIEFYDPFYLCIVYKKSLKHKLDGVIVWSTSKNMKKRCNHIKSYVDKVFGPYVKTLKPPNTENRSKINILAKKSTNGGCKLLLTPEKIEKWCQTSFYGPNCTERKFNSSGLDKNKTGLASQNKITIFLQEIFMFITVR